MPSTRPALLLLTLTAWPGAACLVSTAATDAALADGAAADGQVAGDAAAGADRPVDAGDSSPSANACDLLRQDCPERKACYPDGTFSGATRCLFPGSGGDLAPCLLHEECDARFVCLDLDGDSVTVCTPVCRPLATPTGCAPGASCRPLPTYGAGACAY